MEYFSSQASTQCGGYIEEWLKYFGHVSGRRITVNLTVIGTLLIHCWSIPFIFYNFFNFIVDCSSSSRIWTISYRERCLETPFETISGHHIIRIYSYSILKFISKYLWLINYESVKMTTYRVWHGCSVKVFESFVSNTLYCEWFRTLIPVTKCFFCFCYCCNIRTNIQMTICFRF